MNPRACDGNVVFKGQRYGRAIYFILPEVLPANFYDGDIKDKDALTRPQRRALSPEQPS